MTAFTLRSLQPAEDHASVMRLFRSVASFDGGVIVPTADELATILDQDLTGKGAAWRVAVLQDSVVGVLDVRFIGTKRTEVRALVNPAFRRQGIGTALINAAPSGKRLLVTSRASVPAATALLTKSGFSERHREVRLRQAARPFEPLEVPTWATIEEDRTRNPRRFVAMLTALGEDDISEPVLAAAVLARPGCRVFYISSPKGDDGMCLVAASADAKKGEQLPDGRARGGGIERVALTKALRGKGVSRPLVRIGLRALIDDGYDFVDVTADRRRQASVDLYLGEGFEIIDENIFWIRRDDEA